MKKSTLILATLAMAAVLTTSCKKEETRIITLENPPSAATKTTVDENGVSHWQYGEQLRIFSRSGYDVTKPVIEYGGYPAVSLEGVADGTTLYAAFAAEPGYGVTVSGHVGNRGCYNIPANYVVSDELPNNLPLYGIVKNAVDHEKELMTFRHVFAFIKVAKSDHSNFHASEMLTITAEANTSLNGVFNVAYNEDGSLVTAEFQVNGANTNTYIVSEDCEFVYLPIVAKDYFSLSINYNGTPVVGNYRLQSGYVYTLSI